MMVKSEIKASRKSDHLSVFSIIEAHAKRIPDAIAIYTPGEMPICYSHFFEHLKNTIDIPKKEGIGRNDRIAIVLPNGSQMATVFLTIASCATAAPLNPAFSESEFEFYLSDINAKALIVESNTDSPATSVAEAIDVPVIELSPSTGLAPKIFELNFQKPPCKTLSDGYAQADDIALVLHTSGTTSRPKLVPLTHKNICTSAYNIQRTLKLDRTDRCLNVMPLFHIHGLIGALLSSFFAGASVVCTPGFYVNQFFDWMDEFQPTWFTAVPTMLQGILNRAKSHNRIIRECPLRFIRSCSAALPPKVMQEMENVFDVPVIESYGMTEASHEMTSNPLPPGKRKTGSVGMATGSRIAIIDQSGKILSSGKMGEILIRGQGVTSGYENNPAANKVSFTQGWFRTGDQGYLDSEGYLYITGRIKEIINRGGEKIAPLEIDNILMKHPAVQQAVTFPITHPTLGEDIAAAVVLKKTKAVTRQELQSFVAKHLADFKIPRRIIFLSDIPKGPTGKIQRLKLAAQLKLSAEKAPQSSLPKPATMKRSAWISTLMEIWKAVMGLTEIDPDDNFFQMGGDSIQAAQILARIKNTFGVELSYVIFLNAPTVDGMASAIAALQKTPVSRKTASAHPLELTASIENRDEPF